jgi:phospholipid/cholesterol/gamma-HCH transport system permease protein
VTVATENAPAEAPLQVSRPDERTLLVRLAGSWTVHDKLPATVAMERAMDSGPRPERVTFDAGRLGRWDSGLLTFLIAIREAALARKVGFDPAGLPEGVRSLIRLASAVPERAEARREIVRPPFLARVGIGWTSFTRSAGDAVAFVGETTLSLLRLFTGRAQFQRGDLFLFVQQVGAQALPIVALISILVGLILAFVGSIQLQMFGAQIYVANLVAIGMTREMGAMMTGIIMAGRTGAAFAAQLGTMQVNEEIDALKTLGVQPTDFLVLPRMVALIVMMPLLCVYANVLGIFGGFLVGVGMLDISPVQYWNQTVAWLRPGGVLLGIGKSVIFGIIIAISGCLRGIQCGRSAAAVGSAATSSVVTSIVWIIVADGLFAVVTSLLGI